MRMMRVAAMLLHLRTGDSCATVGGVRHAVIWALYVQVYYMMHYAVTSLDPEFIMKADDDTYVNIPVVMNLVQHFPTDRAVYAGHQRYYSSCLHISCRRSPVPTCKLSRAADYLPLWVVSTAGECIPLWARIECIMPRLCVMYAGISRNQMTAVSS